MSKKDYDLKYQKANIKRVYLTLNKEHDKDIIAYLDAQSNVNGTLKRIIRKEMEHTVSDNTELVRCKNCIHRPKKKKDYLEFPDGVCPCQCDDDWYDWMPDDDWFCGNGDKK